MAHLENVVHVEDLKKKLVSFLVTQGIYTIVLDLHVTIMEFHFVRIVENKFQWHTTKKTNVQNATLDT